MGKSKELATGAAYVDTSGDTMTGDLSVANGGVHVTSPTGIEGLIVDTDQSNTAVSGRIVLKNNTSASSVYYSDSLGWTFHTGTVLGTTSGTQRMYLTPQGYLKTPYQPFFDGYMYTTGALAANTILALSQSSNTGITLGNNNTRLTVPVDGYYFIHASQMAQTINGMYAYFSLLVNGIDKYHSHNNFFSESNKDFHITKVVHLAANDYIEFAWLYIGVSNVWNGEHSTVSVHKLG